MMFPKPGKPVDQRQADRERYEERRVPFLLRRWKCERCLTARATMVHHKRGRGKYFLDESTWMSVCGPCHIEIHSNVEESYKRGWMQKRLDTRGE